MAGLLVVLSLSESSADFARKYYKIYEMSDSKLKKSDVYDNNYVHSLPPFANSANKLLAEKVDYRLTA